MYEIVKRDESLANGLIREYSDMGFAAVLVGNNSGRVWVDNLENPVSALVWSDGLQCFQFMGCASNHSFNYELKSFIENTVIPFLREKNLDFFEYASDEEEWYPIIKNALPDRVIDENWQYVYKSDSNLLKFDEVSLPEPYHSHQINRNFLYSVINDNIVSNPEFLISYIREFWGSIDNYLNLGNGYAATAENKIVGFSITDFLYKKTYSVGIQTLEQHRRKGLAGTLTKMLLKELCSKGYNIWWDCTDSNIASQKTAESAGLVFHHKYKVCWFNL